jgi:hypothetical protein
MPGSNEMQLKEEKDKVRTYQKTPSRTKCFRENMVMDAPRQ